MEQIGISTGKVSIEVMMENKEVVVKQLTGGVSALLSGNVDILAGTGKLRAKRVLFTGHDGVQSELKLLSWRQDAARRNSASSSIIILSLILLAHWNLTQHLRRWHYRWVLLS